jgi:DinB superfamily
VTDLCTGFAASTASTAATASDVARERIFAWLAEGAREVGWALCSVPQERWTAQPPANLGVWPAFRHARHLALRERHLTLPAVSSVLDPSQTLDSAEFERLDSAWECQVPDVDELLRGLAETRFELLQRLEAAPDAAWHTSLPEPSPLPSAAPLRLDTLLLRARQHELEHLAEIWRVALYWDRVASFDELTMSGSSVVPDLPFHSADRFSQGVTLR